MLHQTVAGDNTLHGNLNGNSAQAFAKSGFAKFRVPAKNQQAQLADLFGSNVDGGKNVADFAVAGGSPGDAEDGDGGWMVKGRMVLGSERLRKIGSYNDERGIFWRLGNPGKAIGRDGKNGAIRKVDGAAHDPDLCGAAEAINYPRAAEGFGIVEDHGNARTGFAQNANRSEKAAGKSAGRPGERGVLHEHPHAAPGFGLQAKRIQGCGPAVLIPGNAADFATERMSGEGFGQMLAIFFDGVGGFVTAAE